MSTPQDPQREGRPEPGPYGGQPYGAPAPGQPPAYGQPPVQYPGSRYPTPGQYGPPQQQAPYGGQPAYGDQAQPGFAYSPYGTPYPAGLDHGGDSTPVRRPGLMVLALVLMILAALPFLAAGLALLLVPLNADTLPPGLLDDPRLVQAGATVELLISAARVVGGIIAAIALIYLVFAVFAFRGRNWARILVTVLTVGFALLLIAGLVGGATDPTTLGFAGFVLVTTIGGVVILFLSASSAYFNRTR